MHKKKEEIYKKNKHDFFHNVALAILTIKLKGVCKDADALVIHVK